MRRIGWPQRFPADAIGQGAEYAWPKLVELTFAEGAAGIGLIVILLSALVIIKGVIATAVGRSAITEAHAETL